MEMKWKFWYLLKRHASVFSEVMPKETKRHDNHGLCKIFFSVLPPVLSCLYQSPSFNIPTWMCISLYHGRWLRSCFSLVPFVHVSLHASNIILSSWEEQMGWFLLDSNNSLCLFRFPLQNLYSKMLSWSNKAGARWTHSLNCITLHQNKFWQILQECYF